ncbi:MAG TPA: hypothetical protein VGE67_20335 [Haloferula sp.]
MPSFFYLRDSACCYFWGGYLLDLAEAFDDEFISVLAPVNFAGLMGSERFASIIPGLSRKQKLVLGEFSAAMLGNPDLFGLDADFSAKLRAGVNLPTAA